MADSVTTISAGSKDVEKERTPKKHDETTGLRKDEDPIIHVLEDLPIDFPIDVDWSQFMSDYFFNIVLAFFMVIVVVVSLSQIILGCFLIVIVLLLSLVAVCLFGRQCAKRLKDEVIDAINNSSLANNREVKRLQRLVEDDLVALFTMFFCMGFSVTYFIYGKARANQNVSPVESASPFICFLLLIAVKTAKGLSAEEKANAELRDTFMQKDKELHDVMVHVNVKAGAERKMEGDGPAPTDEVMRLKSHLWKDDIKKTLEERWANLTAEELRGIMGKLDHRERYCETEHYWDSMTLFYPHVFREGFEEDLVKPADRGSEGNNVGYKWCSITDGNKIPSANDAQESEKALLASEKDPGVKDSTGSDNDSHSFHLKKGRMTFRYNEVLSCALTTKGYLINGLLALIHALIPPVWMAVLHTRSFLSEVAATRSDDAVSDQRVGLFSWGEDVWAPQKWPLAMILVSIIAQWTVMFKFLFHFHTISLDYQKYLRKLVLFRASTELGYGTLKREEKDQLRDPIKRTPITCRMAESELTQKDANLSNSFVQDMKAKKTAYATQYRGASRADSNGKQEYILFPYHIAPQDLRRPLGVCLWWKTRHCVKVSIQAKKTDLEIMLTMSLLLIAVMTVNAAMMIIIQSKFTVIVVLTLYDMVVIHYYLIPAINQCVYLGEFLKSDADLLKSFQEQLDVVKECGSGDNPQFVVANALMKYCQHRIKRENGPTIFGLSLTPELRSKLLTLGGIGLIGTASKTLKKFMNYFIQRASKRTMEKASNNANHYALKSPGEVHPVDNKLAPATALRRTTAALRRTRDAAQSAANHLRSAAIRRQLVGVVASATVKKLVADAAAPSKFLSNEDIF